MPWPKGKKFSPEHIAKRSASLVSSGKKRKPSQVIDGVEHWQCPGCSQWLPADAFHKSKRTPSGLTSECQPCHSKVAVATRNPDARRRSNRASEARRRAMQANSPIISSEADIQSAMAMLGPLCLCCGSGENIQVDHIVPISKGGWHHPTNVQPLCRTCNEKKQARTADYRSDEQKAAIEGKWVIEFKKLEQKEQA